MTLIQTLILKLIMNANHSEAEVSQHFFNRKLAQRSINHEEGKPRSLSSQDGPLKTFLSICQFFFKALFAFLGLFSL